MAKKAKKKAAPVRAEKTRSRAFAGEKNRTIQLDKLGDVITWKVPDAPYAGDANLRPAFVGGFELRTQHVNQESDEGIPTRFAEGSKEQRAFEDGYNEAARQDGRHLKPRGLEGSNPPAAAAKTAAPAKSRRR